MKLVPVPRPAVEAEPLTPMQWLIKMVVNPGEADRLAATIPPNAHPFVLNALAGFKIRLDIAEKALLAVMQRQAPAGNGQPPKKDLTVKEVAALTGMSADYVYRHPLEFYGFRVGNRWRFTAESLDRWRRDRQRKSS